jgi:hypothetical protein
VSLEYVSKDKDAMMLVFSMVNKFGERLIVRSWSREEL